MTTYKEIKGTQIEVLESDPSNPVEGQVWYNSTSNVLKGAAATTAGAWSSGGNLNTGRRQMAGAGTATSSIVAGGYAPGGQTAATESWNGSNWTEVNDLNQERYNFQGSGASNTSALVFGGQLPASSATLTELWNGTTFTEQNDRNTGVVGPASAGTATSALGFGGEGPPQLAVTESWSVPSISTKTISTD